MKINILYDAGHKDTKRQIYWRPRACARGLFILSFHFFSGRARPGEQRGSIKWTYGTVVERGTGYGDRGERGRGGLRASCGLDVACDCGIRGCGCCCGGGARAVHVNRARWIGRRERPALRPTVSAGRVRRRRRESGLRCGRLVVVHHCNEPASMFTLLTPIGADVVVTRTSLVEARPRLSRSAQVFIDLLSNEASLSIKEQFDEILNYCSKILAIHSCYNRFN